MKNTCLAIAAIVALVTAAALTPMAGQQQVFVRATEPPSTLGSDGGLESETETEVEAQNKCNISGLGNTCTQTASSGLGVGGERGD